MRPPRACVCPPRRCPGAFAPVEAPDGAVVATRQDCGVVARVDHQALRGARVEGPRLGHPLGAGVHQAHAAVHGSRTRAALARGTCSRICCPAWWAVRRRAASWSSEEWSQRQRCASSLPEQSTEPSLRQATALTQPSLVALQGAVDLEPRATPGLEAAPRLGAPAAPPAGLEGQRHRVLRTMA
ncbi:unnamed protein product [Prorocentrum cordatum]|uniref:Uncharacterized protein n=1 Tax=Prorocentrum cordatum TaxID=2364126 RepID=A0ABN9TBX0_9DINO|nr:unnamed protein product [Polarella glacialis]